MFDYLFFTLLIIVEIAVVLTFITNVYTCLIFFSAKNKKSRPKMLLGNIAVSDILFIFGFVVPFLAITPQIINKNIRIALLIQSLANYLNAFTSYAQSITMTVISIDRYYSIVKGLSVNPCDRISSRSLLAIIWSASLILSLPFLVSFNIYSFNYDTLSMECIHQKYWLINATLFNYDNFGLFTFSSRFLMQYFIPLIITGYNYIRICYRLWTRESDLQIVDSSVTASNIDTKKVIKMLVAVVAVFAVFHMAFYVNILNALLTAPNVCAVKSEKRLSYIMYAVFIISSTINPFIYWWISDSFRDDFRRLIKAMPPFKQCIAFYVWLDFVVKKLCNKSRCFRISNDASYNQSSIFRII